jgi:hypothetical protein
MRTALSEDEVRDHDSDLLFDLPGRKATPLPERKRTAPARSENQESRRLKRGILAMSST